MNTTHAIPATGNDSWGFHGCLQEQAEAAWPIAMQAIADATGEPLEAVRAFLDSCQGRHFGDEVHNYRSTGLDLAPAIEAATRKWMTWTIDRQTSKDYGIPRGLPYLVGFVISAAIHADSQAT